MSLKLGFGTGVPRNGTKKGRVRMGKKIGSADSHGNDGTKQFFFWGIFGRGKRWKTCKDLLDSYVILGKRFFLSSVHVFCMELLTGYEGKVVYVIWSVVSLLSHKEQNTMSDPGPLLKNLPVTVYTIYIYYI